MGIGWHLYIKLFVQNQPDQSPTIKTTCITAALFKRQANIMTCPEWNGHVSRSCQKIGIKKARLKNRAFKK
jgi:hypothetical protein